jgi:hypothetical protein
VCGRDVWREEYIDTWIHEGVYEWMQGSIDTWMHGEMNEQRDILIHGDMEG